MLVDFQRALIRLCLDARLRAEFAGAPAAPAALPAAADGRDPLADFSLTAQERRALAAIPRPALERYAASLVAKRWREVSRVVPLTKRIAPHLGDRYRRWLATAPSPARDTVLDPGSAEALRALPHLARDLAADPGQAIYAPDLLAFEVLAHCSRRDHQMRHGRSRFAVHELAAALQSGIIPMDPQPMPTRFRFEATGVRWWKLG